jgi:hypothetical protein
MTENIATQGGEATENTDMEKQLFNIVEQMSTDTREKFARMLGVKPVRQKKGRVITNEDIKRQALMVGESSHGPDFVPAFSESITQAMQAYPGLQTLIMERWEDGQPISHASLEFDEEIQEMIVKAKPAQAEDSNDLMQRMGQDYEDAVSGSDDAAAGLASIAKEDFISEDGILAEETEGSA